MKVELLEKSKKSWQIETGSESAYPGDEKMKIGCLQRIATATEMMASSYKEMEADRDRYKRWYNQECEKVASRDKAIAAYRGLNPTTE